MSHIDLLLRKVYSSVSLPFFTLLPTTSYTPLTFRKKQRKKNYTLFIIIRHTITHTRSHLILLTKKKVSSPILTVSLQDSHVLLPYAHIHLRDGTLPSHRSSKNQYLPFRPGSMNESTTFHTSLPSHQTPTLHSPSGIRLPFLLSLPQPSNPSPVPHTLLGNPLTYLLTSSLFFVLTNPCNPQANATSYLNLKQKGIRTTRRGQVLMSQPP